MISISSLFELDLDLISDQLKRVGKKAKDLVDSEVRPKVDSFVEKHTPTIKDFIRRSKLNDDISSDETNNDFLKGHENHPHYKELKNIADKISKEDNIKKVEIHPNELPETERSINRYMKENPTMNKDDLIVGGTSNFKTREIHLRGDQPKIVKNFAHETAHQLDKDVANSEDMSRPYLNRKREYVARRFAERYNQPDEYGREFKFKDTIHASKKFADKLTDEERAKKFRDDY